MALNIGEAVQDLLKARLEEKLTALSHRKLTEYLLRWYKSFTLAVHDGPKCACGVQSKKNYFTISQINQLLVDQLVFVDYI